MTALCGGQIPDDLEALSHWIQGARSISGIAADATDVGEATRSAALRQLENLRSYPIVSEGIATEEISIAAWFYDVEGASVEQWDADTKRWVELNE